MMFSNKSDRQVSNASCARGCKSSHDCHVWRKLNDADTKADESSRLESIAQSCSGCQQMFEELSATDLPWWNDARSSWLESELPETLRADSSIVTIEIQSELPGNAEIDIERVSVNFLSPAAHPELLGRLGRYDVERVIGVGGMGVVLKGYDSELHRAVAIKVLSEHLANNSSARKRFAREAQAAAAVVHANVIPIFNVETDGKHPFLVMQCVSGGSLQAKVDNQGPLSVAEALRIVKQTAAGLAAAHEQGLVHRDVKPANILLEENVDRVLLSDFGLARAVDDASFTRTGVVVGTPHYMSPEQANGDSIHCASDQFSLGSVTYFMLTGHPPFRAQTAMGVLNRICHSVHRPLVEVNSNVPMEVSLLVDRLLTKDPARRFESATAIEQEADRLLSALQSGELRLSSRQSRLAGRVKARPKKAWAIASLTGLLAIVVSLATWIGVKNLVLQSGNQTDLSQSGSPSSGSPTHNDSRASNPAGHGDISGQSNDRPPSISLKEFEAAKRLHDAWQVEDSTFLQQLYSAQMQASNIGQTWNLPTVLTTDESNFQAELNQMKLQIEATNSYLKD